MLMVFITNNIYYIVSRHFLFLCLRSNAGKTRNDQEIQKDF